MKSKKERFVNLQNSTVDVFDEERRTVTVAPFKMRGNDPNGLYIVEGEHYKQFVSGRGPLYPFPPEVPHKKTTALPEKDTGDSGDGTDNSTNRSSGEDVTNSEGKLPVEKKTTENKKGKGTKKVGKTPKKKVRRAR